MSSITIEHHGAKINLLDYGPDFYLIAEKANNVLRQLRIGITTWVAADIYTKMQPSIWIYTDERNVNAFCCYKNSQNYIALSIALISACWEAAEGFVDSEKISLVFKLNEEKAPYLKNALFFSMLNFVVAHEFGHIAHGHLKAGKYENCIDETLNIVDKENSKAENWDTQLKEYDADTFAIAIQSVRTPPGKCMLTAGRCACVPAELCTHSA